MEAYYYGFEHEKSIWLAYRRDSTTPSFANFTLAKEDDDYFVRCTEIEWKNWVYDMPFHIDTLPLDFRLFTYEELYGELDIDGL